jgi:hypothetical protein
MTGRRPDRRTRRALAGWIAGLIALAAAWAVAFGPAGASPAGTEPCPDAAPPSTFAAVPDDLENLHFHGGHLYTTGGDGLLRRYAPNGDEAAVADLGQRSGAMVTGTDGALYVRVGSAPGEVWRFADPATSGAHTTAATGLDGANGMAVDADGDIYVSDEPAGRIYRLPAGDPAAWEVLTTLDGPNGLAIDAAARAMYVAMTTDGRSTILALDLDDPSQVTQVASLSFGFVSLNVFATPPAPKPEQPSDPSSPLVFKALDDLTLGPDGMLYAAAWMTGEVLRVDPGTGAACAVASGLAQPSSARVAAGFGGEDGNLFVTDFGSHADLVVDTPAPGRVSVIPLHLG